MNIDYVTWPTSTAPGPVIYRLDIDDDGPTGVREPRRPTAPTPEPLAVALPSPT